MRLPPGLCTRGNIAMSIEWYDFVGSAGVAIVLLAYVGLQVGRVDVQDIIYSGANLLGAALITVSLLFEFNFSAFLIQICWMAISLFGIARYCQRRRDRNAGGDTKS